MNSSRLLGPQEDAVILPCEVHSPDGWTYRLVRRLGTGAFGHVFECEDQNGRRLAAKRIRRGNDEQLDSWAREASLLVGLATTNRAPHPNITNIQNAFYTPDHEYVILELCDGSLEEMLIDRRLGEDWVPRVAHDVLHGLAWIHKTGTLHVDLHPGNVLYNAADLGDASTYTFKLADLGLAERWSNQEGERPELITRDIEDAACLLCVVELNRHDAFYWGREQLLAGVDAKWRVPIERALRGDFQGLDAAAAFFDAITSASGAVRRRGSPA